MSTQPPPPPTELGASPRGEVEPPLAEGRYRLVQVLGVGGMASVYRAFDERLQVFRAVKVLSPSLAAHESLRQRFQTEARTMARLHHPHIVGVHDIGSDGDRVFIVMEMVEGGSAWDYLKDHGPLPPKLAVDICLAVLNALGLAHAKGVIHRDIKPHNVLLARDGTPKVADFGIAHVADSENKGLTKIGSVMGTWGFMAPEQRGGAKGVDARADVYAVGATLYALLTDQIPVDLFVAELDDDLLQAIPTVLKTIIQRATRYRPDDRFESAAAMAADLTEVLGRLPAVPDGQPPLGFVEEPAEEEIPRMTMVPDSALGQVRAALTFPENVFGETGESKPSGPPVSVEPAGPHRQGSPPGFTSVHDLDDDDDLDRDTRKSPLPKLLGAAAVLLLLGAGAWALSGGDERESAGTEVATGLPRATLAPAPPAVVEPVVDKPRALTPTPAAKSASPPKASGSKFTGKASKKTGTGGSTKAAEPESTTSTGTVTPEVKPVAAVTPKEEPATKGVIFVTGSHSGVWLVGEGGRTYKPGEELEPGSYQVKASFDGGSPVVAGQARVASGQRVTLHCDAMFWKCQQQ